MNAQNGENEEPEEEMSKSIGERIEGCGIVYLIMSTLFISIYLFSQAEIETIMLTLLYWALAFCINYLIHLLIRGFGIIVQGFEQDR